jgi:hypothetical protein
VTAPAAPTVLTGSPALPPLLARGALLSPFKRPRPGADFPRTRLVLPGLRVDRARLAAYERVCGFPAGDGLPVTYPHVLGFPLAMRLMRPGLVHTSIAVTRHTRLTTTDAYELAVHVEGLAPHRRGTEAAVVTEARVAGDVVWESRSTYLARHRTPGGPEAAESGESVGSRPPSPESVDPGESVGPGESAENPAPLPPLTDWHLGADLGRRYGAASGDRNPIHLHPLTARLFGFPRPVAHGMWTVARCLAAHGTPDAVAVRARFRAPVLLPGTVTYAAGDGRFELRGGEGRHVTGTVSPL